MKKTIISILCACIPASCLAARQIVMFPDAAAMETAITDFKAGGVDVIRTIPLINALLIGENDGVFLSRVITFDRQAPFTVEDEQIGSIAGEALAPRLALSEISAVENVPAVMGSSSQDTIPWGITRVNAPAVWERLTGNGVKVCVIDTGIDMTHSDLASNYAGGYDFVNEDDNPLDDNGHGTHVSGTIAAVYGNGGVAGVAPNAKLFSVKACNAEGRFLGADLVSGIDWCVRSGANVINMSLGVSTFSALGAAVSAAYEAGVTMVCSAGNSGYPAVVSPASYPQTVAVSASDSNDNLALFSNHGPEIDFIAPGANIVSTKNGGGTATLSGTSMAAPHVAGLAALAVEAGAGSPAAVKEMLANAATKFDSLNKERQGYGMIDAAKIGK